MQELEDLLDAQDAEEALKDHRFISLEDLEKELNCTD
jgi:hypothetical protein